MEAPPRVVSLVPSATETLLALGVVPVGVTRWCEHPELDQVGGTKDPDIAAVVALRPDLVVVDREENRREDAEALAAAGVEVFTLHIRAVEDVGPEIAGLAARLGREDRWRPPSLPPPSPPRATAFVPIWRERSRTGPAAYMTLNAATYGSSVLGVLGLANAFGAAPEPYPSTTLEEAAARGAEVVVAPSEPYPFGERHRAELASVGPMVFVDGQDLFWWGARTEAALERLGAVLAPWLVDPRDQ